jgi:hypothetical protein
MVMRVARLAAVSMLLCGWHAVESGHREGAGLENRQRSAAGGQSIRHPSCCVDKK